MTGSVLTGKLYAQNILPNGHFLYFASYGIMAAIDCVPRNLLFAVHGGFGIDPHTARLMW